MTPRVWVERPIESVEDAEALPEGTIVTGTSPGPIEPNREVAVLDHGEWWGSDCTIQSSAPEILVGYTALVPVDATVEELPIGRRPGRRLCTAWEDL